MVEPESKLGVSETKGLLIALFIFQTLRDVMVCMQTGKLVISTQLARLALGLHASGREKPQPRGKEPEMLNLAAFKSVRSDEKSKN